MRSGGCLALPPLHLTLAPLVCDKLKPTQTIAPRTQQGRVLGDLSYSASGLIKVLAFYRKRTSL